MDLIGRWYRCCCVGTWWGLNREVDLFREERMGAVGIWWGLNREILERMGAVGT